jgi:hypothetical protein
MMRISIDMSRVPPAVELLDVDDHTSLKIVSTQPEHSYIAPETLRALAGEAAAEPEWDERFQRMLEYARRHGWTRDDGAVRAHIEWT